jgi:flagellin
MKINNIMALNSLNKMNKNEKAVSSSMQKVSSGLRINRAADDASGLGISQKMKAQIRGLQQAEHNIQDGVSLIQTAEGGLSQIENPILQRLRELAVQAANGALSPEDRKAIQNEMDQRKQAIDEIANNTSFNRIPLLNVTPLPSSDGNNPQLPSVDVLQTPPVDSLGKFMFKTSNGYPSTEADNDQILVFGNGSTSFPKVQIGGTVHMIQDNQYLQQPTINIGEEYKTVYNIDNVEITQNVKIVGNIKDKYEIKYEIRNTDSFSKNIGFQFHLDTMLGNDDAAPFIVNDQLVSSQTTYEGSSIPDMFTVYNQNTGTGGNSEFKAMGVLKTTDEFSIIEEPSKFAIGQYSTVSNWGFNVNTGAVGDSGYSIWWQEREVLSGESFSVNTFYGQSIPPTTSEPDNGNKGFNIILQTGANAGEIFKVELTDARSEALGVMEIVVDPWEEAANAIAKIDQALEKVSSERGKFGSYQNALEHILNNVSTTALNLTEANSRIESTDMAKEMVELTKNQILSQSSQAMMAQVNKQPNTILELLKP